MRKLKLILVVAAITVLTSCTGVNAQGNRETEGNTAQQPEQKTVKHIIFISVDGLSEGRIRSAYTPNINGLAAGGIKTEAIGVLPANSQAFLASLLTGADPSVHGFTRQGQRIKTQLLPETVNNYGRSSAIIYFKGTVDREFFRQNQVGNYAVSNNDNVSVVSAAIDVFNQNRPYFLGIKLPGVQKTAGNDGARTAELVNAVDEQIGRLFTALRTCGVYEECMIVITGSVGDGWNSARDPEGDVSLTAPVIMAGPGLKSGIELPPVRIIDIAPTVALLAGLQMPPESNGMILWNALSPGAGFLEENLQAKRIKDLSEENIRSTEQVYRLTEEKRLVREEKENVDREKVRIQQTIRGKDRQIILLRWEIRVLKLVELVTVAVLGAGYVVEYFYLKKKFLMF